MWCDEPMSSRPPVGQPGYDALADLYAQTFPTAFQSDLERHVVDCFVDLLLTEDAGMPSVVDVGCGPGHVAGHLADRGCAVVGVDPSRAMLDHARRTHAGITFLAGDARAGDAPLETCAGVLARFSLIHVEPTALPGIVRGWHRRVRAGTLLLVAAQASDDSGVHEFDHLVSRAWRWHPDSLAQMLGDNGFDEEFRVVSRPDADNRFPAVHLLCRSR